MTVSHYAANSAQQLASVALGATYPAGTIIAVSTVPPSGVIMHVSQVSPFHSKTFNGYILDTAFTGSLSGALGSGLCQPGLSGDTTLGDTPMGFNIIVTLSVASSHLYLVGKPNEPTGDWYSDGLSSLTVTSITLVGLRADFIAVPNIGTAPLIVDFIDISDGVPTAWAWTFGDGGTSTAQYPSHTYTVAGSYSITLTVTKTGSSDSVTKSAYVKVAVDVGYEPPPPAGALIEIYAAEAGAARWDDATWDDAVWSTSAWQDVTPESVTATVKWGTSQPERGILSVPDAASWSIDMLDPLRLLDPANTDSPYWGDLVPYLPVRISHRGTIVRTGIAESIQHSFEDDRGYFRVTDKQSTLANAMVPAASELRDGLYARAIDAISAAGVDCTVLPVPPSGDLEAAPWEEPTSDRSAWDWISDAALQLLHIPYIDRYGRLGFRPYSVPLARGRTLEAPELTGLRSIVQYQGLYSRVQVQQTPGDGGLLIERAVTPPPAYGTRTYIHTEPVPNADRWANLILDDRAFAALRWVPGQMYPLTAESVEALATIEAVELVSIVDDYTSPVVRAEVIVLGGTIVLTAKKGDEAKWWFTFEAAQSPETPLVVSGSDPPEYLYRTAGAEFLYRSL